MGYDTLLATTVSTGTWTWDDISRAASVITSSIPYTFPDRAADFLYNYTHFADEVTDVGTYDADVATVTTAKPKKTRKREPKISQSEYDKLMSSDFE